MALTPGTRLGVYQITAQIGVGGMGEVYRATDSNLKRSVAIKVLPASVAGDADRLARFQREAEVLAALNHPNIAAIYGLEKTADFTALIYRRSRVDAAAMTTVQWVAPSAGATGKRETLRARPGADQTLRLSPDGHYAVFANALQGLFQARADGASPPQALTASKAQRHPWSFTPDGKRLAYTSDESERREVYVRPFPPPSASSSGAAGQGGPSTSLRTGKWQVSNNGGEGPRWSRTGHELVYRSGNQLITVSYTVNGASFVADRPRVWIAALGATGSTDWDLAPDGKRVAVLTHEGSGQALLEMTHECDA